MTWNSPFLEPPEIYAGSEAGPAYIRKCGYTISVRLYILELPLHIKAPVFNIPVSATTSVYADVMC